MKIVGRVAIPWTWWGNGRLYGMGCSLCEGYTSLSLSRSLSPYFFLAIDLYLSIYLFLHFSVTISLFLHLYLFYFVYLIHLSNDLSMTLCIYLSIYPSISQPTNQPTKKREGIQILEGFYNGQAIAIGRHTPRPLCHDHPLCASIRVGHTPKGFVFVCICVCVCLCLSLCCLCGWMAVYAVEWLSMWLNGCLCGWMAVYVVE